MGHLWGLGLWLSVVDLDEATPPGIDISIRRGTELLLVGLGELRPSPIPTWSCLAMLLVGLVLYSGESPW